MKHRALHPREESPGTRWIGGWAGLRAGPDAVAKREISFPAGKRIPVVQSIA
jgi:hypothetical protein